MVELFLKNSNLCDHNSPTSQTDGRTDGQTDDMLSQYRALHLSASRGNNFVRRILLNAAARLVGDTRKFDHSLRQLMHVDLH